MGTEQENQGLSEQFDENEIFKQAFESSLKGAVQEEKKVEVQPEEPPVEEVEQTEVAATDNAAEQAASEAAQDPVDDLKARLAALEKERDERAKEAAEWKQKYKSDEGRVAAFQRRAQELERQLRTPKQDTKPAEPTKLKVEESEEWRNLQEIDPAMARLLKNSVEEAVRQAEEKARLAAEAATKPLYEERETEYERRERDELYRLVPNLDAVKSSETYAQWFNDQDESVKNLGYSAKGVYRIMQLYEADMRAIYGAPEQEAKTEAEKPVDNKPQAAPQVAAIQKERERKVQAQGVAAKTVATPTELSDEEIFKRAYNSNLAKRTYR